MTIREIINQLEDNIINLKEQVVMLKEELARTKEEKLRLERELNSLKSKQKKDTYITPEVTITEKDAVEDNSNMDEASLSDLFPKPKRSRRKKEVVEEVEEVVE